MRAKFIALSALLISGVASFACSSEEPVEDEVDVGALTDAELAKTALKTMGAKIDGQVSDQNLCGACHAANNRTTYKHWNDANKTTMAVLNDASKSANERISYMYRTPGDPASGFYPGKIGILTACSHLAGSPYIRPAKHPKLLALSNTLTKLFQGKADDFEKFRNETLMPIESRSDRATATQCEAILTWMDKGMPQLEQLITDQGRPTDCTDDFRKLKEHAISVKATSWQAVNRDARVANFACDAQGLCFEQKFGGKDVFPNAKDTTYGKTWALDGGTVRVVRDLGQQPTYYWSRTSADGRFFASGGSGRKAFALDLQALLDPAGPKQRLISLSANYDPDFFPNNKAFMFQGTDRGGVVCAQSLLTNAQTQTVTFNEPQCNKLDQISLYQTVAQAQGDNSFADIFVINNSFASDNPSLSASAQDLQLTAGPDSKARIAIAVSGGTEGSYAVKEVKEVPIPFHGDTMASRSLKLLGSRVAGEGKMLGYGFHKLTTVRNANPPAGSTGYNFTAAEAGRICMPGNKAQISFDERFLITHHYLTRADFATDADFAPYKDKGAADLWMADFVTGKKTRITRMNPGQFAIFPHFRSDGWIMFEVRDSAGSTYVTAHNAALRAAAADPTP